MTKQNQKRAKIAFLFFILLLFFMIFLGTLFYWAIEERDLPNTNNSYIDSALRGDIYSYNNYTLAKSKKLYKAMVDTRNINPDKKEIFINLYSIYSGEDKSNIDKIISSHYGVVTLSYKIDSITAQRLKELAHTLNKIKVLISFTDVKRGISFKHGLDIIESGEYRVYNYKDALTPIIGYVRKYEKNLMTKVIGIDGIEKQYENIVIPISNGEVKGKKDRHGYIILDGRSTSVRKIDGLNLHLNISLKLQKIVENILDKHKKKFEATEIVACIMENKTGKILTLASSNRYNPSFIKRDEYQNLNITATKFTYEPGSVLKPIIFALLLEKKKVNPYDLVRVYGGKYKIGKHTITDDHKYDWLSAQNVIVHSSNIGISQLAQKLDYIDYYKGLKKYGFSKKSGIDLPNERIGSIPQMHRLKSEIYKATTSYGYGIEATFMQVLKAYNLFNNKGNDITPRIVDYYEDAQGMKYSTTTKTNTNIIPLHIAKQMKEILIKTVNEGTGKGTIIKGLEIGGKTGTAKIAEKGRYSNLYNSSFFGFANDTKRKYTIGVLVRKPSKHYYYASLSAVPVFKGIVEVLVQENFLQLDNISPSKPL